MENQTSIKLNMLLSEVISALSAVKPLANVLPDGTELFYVRACSTDECETFLQVLQKLMEQMHFNKPLSILYAVPEDAVSFNLAINNYLNCKFGNIDVKLLNNTNLQRLEQASGDILSKTLQASGEKAQVSVSGAQLTVCCYGDKANAPLLLVSACGMPLELSGAWIKHLQQCFYVVTWETRYLDGGDIFETDQTSVGGDLKTSVAQQVNDVIAVTEHLKLEQPHLMGFCGGAVIALQAMAEHPEMFRHGSVWHGDLHFSEANQKTDHQENVAFLMEMGSKSRSQACSYRKLMARPSSLNALPLEEAPLILYPYANDELFYRYCLLNGAIMSHSISAALPEISKKVLVVTSKTDHTAHPEGSRRAFRELPDAQLVEKLEGDHISLFGASESLRQTADNFLKTG